MAMTNALTDAEVAGYHAATTWNGQPRGSGRLHGELQISLARHLREAEYLTFTEVQINDHGDRADVIALKPSYSKLDLRIYECKATRADLNRGLNTPTWRVYREYAHRVIFAMPAGLAKVEEIPEECGIITRSPGGTWRHIRPGRSHTPPKLDHWLILALLFRGYEEHRTARDLRLRLQHTARDGALDYKALATYAGHDLARRLMHTEHVLAQPLQDLAAVVEATLGVKLDTPHHVANLTARLEVLRDVLASFEENREALDKISHYLSAIGARWYQDRAKLRGEIINGLP